MTPDQALGLIGAVQAVIGTLLQLDGPKQERTFWSVIRPRQQLDELRQTYLKVRPTQLYNMVRPLALDQRIRTKSRRLVARAQQFSTLPESDRLETCSTVAAWGRSVGRLAREAHEDSLPLLALLRTHHLLLIREYALVLPMIVACQDALDTEETEHVLWGLALGSLAIEYHRRSAVHREHVYIFDPHQDLQHGPVLRVRWHERRLRWFHALWGLKNRRYRLSRLRMMNIRRAVRRATARMTSS